MWFLYIEGGRKPNSVLINSHIDMSSISYGNDNGFAIKYRGSIKKNNQVTSIYLK